MNKRKIFVFSFALAVVLTAGCFLFYGQTKAASYQFVPTGGQLIRGVEQAITSGTAAGGADGTNLGSWKATLSNDDYHWVVGGENSGGVEIILR